MQNVNIDSLGLQKYFQSLLQSLTEIVQDSALSTDSRLEGISKYNPVTNGNLQDVVWSPWKQELTEDEEEFTLVKYLSGIRWDEGILRL